MKIHLNRWLKTGDISPLKWGDSKNDILNVIPEWKTYFDESNKSKCPYLVVDNIEFYFEEDEFRELNFIVIGVWHFYRDYKSDFFSHDWIRHNLNIPSVRQILKKLHFNFEEAWIENWQSRYIMPNRNVRLTFDDTDYNGFDENKTALQKIFISPVALTEKEIKEKKIKITRYNNP
jgi:hypothetical protein